MGVWVSTALTRGSKRRGACKDWTTDEPTESATTVLEGATPLDSPDLAALVGGPSGLGKTYVR
jgi:hypothetical protein